jgi:hypothetical protein
MKVGIIQCDGKIPNLALMKIFTWHKQRGDDVVFMDISHQKFDMLYGSKIFMGGTGYEIKSQLPTDIEEIVPDYDAFKLDHSIGFTSRGCIRNCEFCIVREKEGFIHEVNTSWMVKQKLLLLDNNFLASPLCKEKLHTFIDNNHKVCFNQGLDIRLVTKELAELLAKVDYRDDQFKVKRLYFAWDKPEIEQSVLNGIKLLSEAGIKPQHLMFYVIVGFDTTFEQDMYRVMKLKELGCKPYVMIFNKQSCDKQLKKLQRWINRRYYEFISWEKFGVKQK